MRVIEVWTDGASRGNPGPGAYAALFYIGDELKNVVSAYKSGTTNNEMECMALMKGLERIASFDRKYDDKFQYDFYSDSSYTVDGYNKWLAGWIKNNSLSEKANSGIWQSIHNLRQQLASRSIQVTVNKVKGHAGITKNEAADKECNRLMDLYTRMPEPEKVIRVNGDIKVQKVGDEIILTSESLRALNGYKVEMKIKIEQLNEIR
jgi:ribonuclease HI